MTTLRIAFGLFILGVSTFALRRCNQPAVSFVAAVVRGEVRVKHMNNAPASRKLAETFYAIGVHLRDDVGVSDSEVVATLTNMVFRMGVQLGTDFPDLATSLLNILDQEVGAPRGGIPEPALKDFERIVADDI